MGTVVTAQLEAGWRPLGVTAADSKILAARMQMQSFDCEKFSTVETVRRA